jgi:hypothetical protein
VGKANTADLSGVVTRKGVGVAAVIHGTPGWFYVIYFALTRTALTR